ncbi:tegument protein [Saguinine gammaherpesvirus 1]|uniref:Tegument protein n=1 Tax=Saguinine gammaherpesvirus 1 TaxID=2169901 RepID=A0A9Q8QW65_9GAMA|nr:tegument protein [Saguinine gammaherpesvirus 1]
MRQLLSKNYADTTQYFLYICNAKSGAIILKNKLWYLFDPHCIPMIPCSPAHVIKTDKLDSLLSHIAGPNDEYTACFLYIVPQGYVGPDQFIANHYRVVSYDKIHGPQINLSDIIVPDQNTILLQPTLPSISDEGQPTDDIVTEKITSPPSRESTKTQPDPDTQKKKQGHTNTRPKITIVPTKDPDIIEAVDDPIEDNRDTVSTPIPETTNVRNKINPNRRPKITIVPIQDTPSPEEKDTHMIDVSAVTQTGSGTSNKRGQAQSTNPSNDREELGNLLAKVKRRRLDSHNDVPDRPNTPAPDATIVELEDFDIEEPIMLEDDFDVADFLDVNNLEEELAALEDLIAEDIAEDMSDDEYIEQDIVVSFSTLNRLIDNLGAHAHISGLPVMIDPDTRQHYRETIALHSLDRLLTAIILEHGLISHPSKSPSICKSLLQFFILWAKKLKFESTDIDILLSSNLEIPVIYDLIEAGSFKDKTFLGHLVSKLQACFPLLHQQYSDNYRTLMGKINNMNQSISFMEHERTFESLIMELTSSFPEGFYIVCNKSEHDHLVSKLTSLKEDLAQQNSNINNQEEYFKTLMSSLISNQPPVRPAVFLDVLRDQKIQTLEQKCLELQKNIEDEMIRDLEDFSSSLGEATDVSHVPDIDLLLQRILNTINFLRFCTTELNLESNKIIHVIERLQYIGGEAADIFNQSWPFEGLEVQPVISIFSQVRERLRSIQEQQANKEKLENILVEIEALIDSQKNTSGGETTDLPISLLETYMVNAGALVTPNTPNHDRYQKLKSTIQTFSVSEGHMIDKILHLQFNNLQEELPKIMDTYSSSDALKQSNVVKSALQATTVEIIKEYCKKISMRDLKSLPNTTMVAIYNLMSVSMESDASTLQDIMGKLVKVAKKSDPKDDLDTLNMLANELSSIKKSLTGSKINKTLKRECYTLVQKFTKTIETYIDSRTLEDWKLKVKEFTPTNLHDVMLFINSAPTPKAKQYAKRTLKETIERLKAQQEKQIQQDTQVVPMDEDPVHTSHTRTVRIWPKIQEAFNNFTFLMLTPQDWEDLSREYESLTPSARATLGPSLMKLMTNVEKTVDEMISERIETLLTNPEDASIDPPSWIVKFESNANFFLKTINLPLVNEHANKLTLKCLLLQQCLSTNDVRAAALGSVLEPATKIYTSLIERLDAAYNEYYIQTNSEVAAYVSKLTNEPEIAHTPPTLIPWKIVIPFEDQQSIDSLPAPFVSAIKTHEKYLIAKNQTDMEMFKHNISEAEAHFRLSMEKHKETLMNTLKQALNTAPVTITSKKLHGLEPIAYLENILRDKNILEKETYSTTLSCLSWLEFACKTIMAIETRMNHNTLNSMLKEINSHKEKIVALKAMETEANKSNDPTMIKRAIKELDHKRIQGGTNTIKEWEEKLRQIETMIMDVETQTEIVKTLENIVATITVATDTIQIMNITQEIITLTHKADAANIKTKNTSLYAKILELRNYAQYRMEFYKYYSDYPSVISPQNDLSLIQPTIDIRKRLEIYGHVVKTPITTWLEVIPTIDNVRPTLVPVNNGPPLNWMPIFPNPFYVLAHVLPNRNNGTVAVEAISSAIVKKLGHMSMAILWNHWEDVQQIAPDIISSYVKQYLNTDLVNNDFASMTLLTHMITMALKGPVELPETEVIPTNIVRLNHAQTIGLIIALWPKLGFSMLQRPTFSEAVSVYMDILSKIYTIIPNLWLEKYIDDNVININYMNHSTYFTDAFLMCPGKWKSTNILKYMWENPEFLKICNHDAKIARITFLMWAYSSLDPVIINQLWSSFTNKNIHSHNSYIDLLSHIIQNNHTTWKVETNTLQPSHVYGNVTGRMFVKSSGNIHLPHKETSITTFEIILGSIMFHVPCYIMAASKLIQGSKHGDILLVSTVLDCLGQKDPFKTFQAAPRTEEITMDILKDVCTKEEESIFHNHIKWLQGSTRDTWKSVLPSPLVVLVDLSDTLIGAHIPGNTQNFSSHVHLIISTQNKNWPNEDLIHISGHPNEDVLTRLGTELSLYKDVNLDHIFHGYPKGLVDYGRDDREDQEAEVESSDTLEDFNPSSYSIKPADSKTDIVSKINALEDINQSFTVDEIVPIKEDIREQHPTLISLNPERESTQEPHPVLIVKPQRPPISESIEKPRAVPPSDARGKFSWSLKLPEHHHETFKQPSQQTTQKQYLEQPKKIAPTSLTSKAQTLPIPSSVAKLSYKHPSKQPNDLQSNPQSPPPIKHRDWKPAAKIDPVTIESEVVKSQPKVFKRLPKIIIPGIIDTKETASYNIDQSSEIYSTNQDEEKDSLIKPTEQSDVMPSETIFSKPRPVKIDIPEQYVPGKGEDTLSDDPVHISPIVSPTVKIQLPSIEEIIRDPETLSRPRPKIISIPGLVSSSTQSVEELSTYMTEAKLNLINFIELIQTKIRHAKKTLLTSIHRIKLFYL